MAENYRIMVVDDESDIVQAYDEILAPKTTEPTRKSSRLATAPVTAQPREPEYEIFRATSGEEALKIVQSELKAGRRIACGFFDVKMEGGMDGLQTLQEIWKLDPELHATVVTAYHDRDVNDIDLFFGARFKDQWDYLNKPFTRAEIIQKARQMIAAWNRKRHLEQAQAQLIQADRMATIGQLARAVGHEFGNVLQTIIGQADLAIEQKDPEKIKARLELIMKTGERASVLIRNILSFSKKSSPRTQVDLTKIIKETLFLVGRQFAKSSIQAIDQTQPCSPIEANGSEIEQVILNLVINSIHATPAGGKIAVGCKDEEDHKHVLFWVQDTGTGIPPEVLPKIFEYAFTTKGEIGSGLGLSISKSIIENHKGSISVQTQIGHGTVFIIRLPRSQ